MTARTRIVDLLGKHPDGLDDDALALALGFAQRQQANARCRELEREGLVARRAVMGKIRNFLVKPGLAVEVHSPVVSNATSSEDAKPWHWEGNVVDAVRIYLAARRWEIASVANTATGEAGADIRARRDDQILVVEVKGYPSKVYERGEKKGLPKRTNPSTQARHWLAGAVLTALIRLSENPRPHVAIAFPNFPTYRNMLERISEVLRTLGLIILVVREDGAVEVVSDVARIIAGRR